MSARIIKKIRGFVPTGYNIRKAETQIGDSARDKKITWYVTINNGSTWKTSKDLEMYLAEYNTMTKEATFRNYKNQIVVVPNMGVKTMTDYVWSMAAEVFNKFKEGDLFRPQYGLDFRKS
jgi:hypothetical protein